MAVGKAALRFVWSLRVRFRASATVQLGFAGMLNQIAESLWVAEQPLRYLGVVLTTRMTIIRLAGGVLLVHSPIHLTQELLFAAASIGSVRFIVAPNRFHHLFVPDWQKAYPNAQTFCAPGLDTKRGDLNFTATLSDEPPAAWPTKWIRHSCGHFRRSTRSCFSIARHAP
jgi:hypothetical protein